MAMTVEQAYQILSKFHGYTGPRTKRAISQFVNARDLPVAVTANNRGGLIGMQEGGSPKKKKDDAQQFQQQLGTNVDNFNQTQLAPAIPANQMATVDNTISLEEQRKKFNEINKAYMERQKQALKDAQQQATMQQAANVFSPEYQAQQEERQKRYEARPQDLKDLEAALQQKQQAFQEKRQSDPAFIEFNNKQKAFRQRQESNPEYQSIQKAAREVERQGKRFEPNEAQKAIIEKMNQEQNTFQQQMEQDPYFSQMNEEDKAFRESIRGEADAYNTSMQDYMNKGILEDKLRKPVGSDVGVKQDPRIPKNPKRALGVPNEELTEAGKRKRIEERRKELPINPPNMPFAQPTEMTDAERKMNELSILPGNVDPRRGTDFGVRQAMPSGTPRQDQEYTQEDIVAGQQQLAGDVMTGRADEVIRKSDVAYVDPNMEGATIDPSTGQVVGDVEGDTTIVEKVRKADTPDDLDASTVDTVKAETGVKTITDDTTAQTMDKEDATKVEAQVKERQKKDPVTGEPMVDEQGNPVMETYTDIGGIDAATLSPEEQEKLKMKLAERKVKDLDEREKITGTGVDRDYVEETFGSGEVEAASMRDELKDILGDFDDGQTPVWAAGAMRKANQMLAARGLSASSLAGQAVVQAMMEAALPIAQTDAANKQEMAVLKAKERAKFMQQEFDQAFEAKVKNAARVSEIANLEFSAEQQVNLENSKMAQTVALQNLNNEQALVMAEAAQIAALETEGLSNMQQAQVENAKNFLQIDMANLANEQQTELFKSQQNINALLTDVAAENASNQFNATSENQTNQFNNSLKATISQYNASQVNAMNQFNAGQENAMEQFNTQIKNQRDQFNANNSLVVAQANAKWRQDTATMNTAAQNQANFDYNKEINAITTKALDEIWQRERDLMAYTFKSSESAMDRMLDLLLGDKDLEKVRLQLKDAEAGARASVLTKLFFGLTGIGS